MKFTEKARSVLASKLHGIKETVQRRWGIGQKPLQRDVPLSFKIAYIRAHRKLDGVRRIVNGLLSSDPWTMLNAFNIYNWTPYPKGQSPRAPIKISAATQPRHVVTRQYPPFQGTPLEVEFGAGYPGTGAPLTDDDKVLMDLWSGGANNPRPETLYEKTAAVRVPLDEAAQAIEALRSYGGETPPFDEAALKKLWTDRAPPIEAGHPHNLDLDDHVPGNETFLTTGRCVLGLSDDVPVSAREPLRGRTQITAMLDDKGFDTPHTEKPKRAKKAKGKTQKR